MDTNQRLSARDNDNRLLSLEAMTFPSTVLIPLALVLINPPAPSLDDPRNDLPKSTRSRLSGPAILMKECEILRSRGPNAAKSD